MQIAATTVEEYLSQLPEERRAVISAVREVIVKNLPEGYQESTRYGMITYEIPLERYPKTYNKQPLQYVALAAQKNNYSVYLSQDEAERTWIAEEFVKAGKKLDRGKSCLRFKRLEDLPLDTIGQAVARTSVEDYLAYYESVMNRNKEKE